MKSNKMMNIAGVLLILVLLSTCGLSKTYAKYITQSSSNDEARVAKWGVQVTVTGDNSFSTAYKDGSGILNDSELHNAEILRNNDIVTTHGINADILAPGTQGNLCTVSITGRPEVAVNVITKVKGITITGWGIGKEEYFPIIFNINGTDYGIGQPADADITNIATLEQALTNAINSTKSYEPNTNLATEVDDLTINWRWNFFHGFVQAPGEDLGVAYYDNGKDTALADMLRFALNGDPNFKVPTISFDLEVEVVQID